MIRFVQVSILALTVLSAAPVLADEMKKADSPDATAAKVSCTAVDMDATNAKIKAMTDTAKQKMAMDHMDMAKKSMDGKDMAACEMHMKEAMGSMGTTTK